MIRYKKWVFYIVLSLQLHFSYSQWYRGSNSEPVFYVPASAPPEYARAVKGYPSDTGINEPVGVLTGLPQSPDLPFVPPPPGYPFGVPPPGFPPSPLYEGQYQAAAAANAHPNQPVIIINNGDYGTKKEKSGLFGDDGGGLLALLLASHHGHGHHEYAPEPLPAPVENAGVGGNGPLNINITIIMPKSDDTKTKSEDD